MSAKISIITVNLNNAENLKKTIESVLMQTYSDIEYLIIDGASKDESVDIIKDHEKDLAYWCSEKDNGIYDAMNKGIKKSTGDYLLFLNSGDTLVASDVLEQLILSGDGKDIIYGNVNYIFDTFIQRSNYPAHLAFDYFIYNTLPHPGTIIKRIVFEKAGLYDITLPISADWKLFLSAIFKYKCNYKLVDITVSDFYMNGISCQPETVKVVEEEKERVFTTDFPELMNMIEAYRQFHLLRSSKLINILKKFGFFKYLA